MLPGADAAAAAASARARALLLLYYLPFLVAPADGSLLTTTATRGRRSNYGDDDAIPEPYPYLHSYNATALPSRPLSPDPLVTYKWNDDVDQSQLQLYDSYPVRAQWAAVDPLQSSFEVLSREDDAAGAAGTAGNNMHVEISGGGTLTLDFGTERSGWFEFDSSASLTDDVLRYLTCSLSEYNLPLKEKTKRPVRYNNTHFRLETNDELYEGIRFAFVTFDPPRGMDARFALSNLRVVSQIRPVSYAAHYSSSDELLTKVWYTGAYGVRLNMHRDDFGTVLIERGDRVAIQGDQHPTIAAALAAFGGDDGSGRQVYGLIRSSLNKTDSGCSGCHVIDDGIMSYPVYWAMSVMDYYWASGDVDTFARFVPDIVNILDHAAKVFYPDRPNIVWQGWDDRIDDGWCGPCCDEAQRTFAALVVRAFDDFVQALVVSGVEQWAGLSAAYSARSNDMSHRLTNHSNWSDGYGLHASANAINANLPSLDSGLIEDLFTREFNDVVRICSFAPFNQYWILQAMGNAGKMDHALASIKLCWGSMIKISKGCFLETFDPRWKEEGIMEDGSKAPGSPSYCHPWSSGVTHWLTENHVGIRPIKPGYDGALISPYVSKLNPIVNGSLGTPHGTVEVEATLNDTTCEVQIRASVPVKSRVALRRERDGCILLGYRYGDVEGAGEAIKTYSVDPRRLDNHLHPNVVSSLGFSRILKPGTYTVVGVYGGCFSNGANAIATASDGRYPPFPPLSYPSKSFTDVKTKGNWVGNYGKDGYVLFGFDNGTDVFSMPSYVTNITSYYMWGGGRHRPKSQFRGTSQDMEAYLEAPSGKHARSLGSIGDEVVQGRGLVFDVPTVNNNALRTANRRISIYMVAKDPVDEFVIKAMDYQSRSNIAPLPKIRDFQDGMYWSIEYNGGMRIRLTPRFGSTAISAIFFDTIVN